MKRTFVVIFFSALFLSVSCGDEDSSVKVTDVDRIQDEEQPDLDETSEEEPLPDIDKVDDEPVEKDDQPTPDMDEESDDDEIGECTGLSTEFGSFSYNPKTGNYNSVVDLGDGSVNLFSVLLLSDSYDPATVPIEVDLGAGDNLNYKTCLECAILWRNIKDGVSEKAFFQESGSLSIENLKLGTGNQISEYSEVTISNLKLIEVTVAQDFQTTPVANGGCFEIATVGWNTMPECESDEDCGGLSPACDTSTYTCVECTTNEHCPEGKLCNTAKTSCYDPECTVATENIDCGGSTPACHPETRLCVECTSEVHCDENSTCNPATNLCEPTDLCTGISLEKISQDSEKPNLYQSLYTPDTGAKGGEGQAIPDILSIWFYGDGLSPGSYSLMDGGDANYATCSRCVLVVENLSGDTFSKTYFQQYGTLNIDYVDSNSGSIGSLDELRLIEVSIDSSTVVSTPVPGGDCLHIQSAAWNTTAETACDANEDCSGDKALCKVDPGICVECLTDDDCTGNEGTDICDQTLNACVPVLGQRGNNCDSQTITEIIQTGLYEDDISLPGYTDDFSPSPTCSASGSENNGKDMVFKLLLNKQSDVLLRVDKAPGDDSFLYMDTICGSESMGCSDNISDENRLSRLDMQLLSPGEYYVVADVAGNSEGEISLFADIMPIPLNSNYSFEKWSDGLPLNWTKGVDVAVSEETLNRYFLDKSCRVTLNSESSGNLFISHSFTVEVGKVYDVTAKVFASKGTVKANIYYDEVNKGELSDNSIVNEWQTISYSFSADQENDSLKVRFYPQEGFTIGETVIVDDFRIVERVSTP